MTKNRRADELLVERGLAPNPEKARALIMAGLVVSGEQPVRKPGEPIGADAALAVKTPRPYVSRGGLKLAEALDGFGLDVAGKAGLDIGASTGGFTDCLLQRGARRVYAVDVDTKQLDWALRRDPRIVLIEKNARNLAAADLAEAPDIITMDVSFISILKVFPALRGIPGEWVLVSLIKPQFEAERREVGDKGIVRDPGVHERVLARVAAEGGSMGFGLRGLIRCSTHGQKGNVEFFGCWAKNGPEAAAAAVERWIKEVTGYENP